MHQAGLELTKPHLSHKCREKRDYHVQFIGSIEVQLRLGWIDTNDCVFCKVPNVSSLAPYRMSLRHCGMEHCLVHNVCQQVSVESTHWGHSVGAGVQAAVHVIVVNIMIPLSYCFPSL